MTLKKADAEIDHFTGLECNNIGLLLSRKRKKEQRCIMIKAFLCEY